MKLKLIFCMLAFCSIAFFGCTPRPAERSDFTPTTTMTGTSVEPSATASPSSTRTPIPPAQFTFTKTLTATAIPFLEEIIDPSNAARVLQITQWGSGGTVNQVAWSPDGQAVASATSLGIHIYAAPRMEEIRYIQTDAAVNALAFSPDGQILASGFKNGKIALWQTSNGARIRTLKPIAVNKFTDEVLSLAFSPDGTMLASGLTNAPIHLWRVSDGILIRKLDAPRCATPCGWVISLPFSPDGKDLVAGFYGGIALWRVSEGRLVRFFQKAPATFIVALSTDGQMLAYSKNDGTVALQRVSDGSPIRVLEEH